jgi:hypothetical protein
MSEPDIKVCWKLRDPAFERDVLAFWREDRMLPTVADVAKRIKEICVVAYDGPRIVGVVEANVRQLGFVRARIAMLKAAVAPAHRQSHLVSRLLAVAKEVLEKWSLEHPAENVKGIGCIVQTRVIDQKLKEPVWPLTSMMVVNYTPKGDQVRLAWFKHARLD